MNHSILVAGVVGILLAGCAAPAPVTPASVSATGTLAVNDASGRQLQAVVTPWGKADIDHVQLTLSAGASVVATLSVTQAELLETVTFTNLVRNTSYHVVARAWSDAAGIHEIDNLAASAATCTTDFATLTDAQVTTGPILLRLVDKVFAGSGTSTGIGVTDGAVVDTTATQGIQLN